MKFRAVALSTVMVWVVFAAGSAVWAQHAQYYVLDAFGGVHAGDGAPAISPSTPYFGFDVAADIDYIPVGTNTSIGDGIIVLDKFGGVHPCGALAADPPASPTPYFGFDAARAIVYRDIPTRSSWGAVKDTVLTSTSYVVVTSATLVAPDDGFILVSASANMTCGIGTGGSAGQLSLNVDSAAADFFLVNYVAAHPDCGVSLPGGILPNTPISLTRQYPVSAGFHTVNLLGRKLGGAVNPRIAGAVLTAVFVDQNGTGSS